MSEIIADNHAVTIEYTLRNTDGEVLDSSDSDEPLTYLHGFANIVPGLEAALTGKAVGDSVQVVIAPADAYGEHDPEGVQIIPRDVFPAEANVTVGDAFTAELEDDNFVTLHVVGIEEGGIKVDMNHPLAGETLHFDVKVIGIRAASAHELAHGHAHGADGHAEHH